MKPRIIIKLDQGLGNQLFQLSYAIWAARKDVSRILIDSSWYGNIPRDQTHREMSIIEIIESLSIPILSPDEIHQIRPITIDTTTSKWDCFSEHVRSIADEHPVHLIARGFNYAYVKDSIAILQECMRTASIDISNADASFFKDNSVIGVHIRQGDYLDSAVRAWIGIVNPADQIKEAERVASELVFDRPVKIAVFSNGPVDFPFDRSFLSADAGGTHGEIETFKLMSMCDWLITANSTYSIFASYLGPAMRGASLPKRYANLRQDLAASLIGPRMALYDNDLI